MNTRLRTGLILALVLALCVAAAIAAKKPIQKIVQDKIATAHAGKKLFNAEVFTLDNGMEIVVISNHRAPVVTHSVWYKAGAAEEVPGKSGAAHFLEHLMFKGSDGFGPGEFSRKIRALGGNDNAFTGHDYTAYHQSVSVENLETVMTMEAGRMRGLKPPMDHVDSERKVIIEERNERTDNDPNARLAEQVNALLYVNHPYGKPVIGWAHEMATLYWEDEKAFYDRWYAPDNAILIVSGDVTGQQVYDLAKKIYGPIPKNGNVPSRTRLISPPLKGAPEVTLTDPNVREPTVQKVYRLPSAHQNKQESLALQVLEEILGGGPTSRLYKALVVEQKAATGAGFSYSTANWDDSEGWVYATPVPGGDLRKLKDLLDDQLRILIKGGVTDDELKDAKTRMEAASAYARDSLEGPVMIFGYALATGQTVDDVEFWPHDISQVTAQQVQDAAKKYLDPDAAYDHSPVTGYMLPEAAAQPSQTEAAP
jgi:zinc protease